MLLNRLGNKRRMAARILPYIPEHRHWIEPFFGAGGLFFAKPKALRNIVNDLDEEVYNLFRVMLDRIPLSPRERELAYVYADPPYLGTANNYASASSWTQKDASDLFDTLVRSGLRFGISEFDHPDIIELAEEHRLNVIDLGERKNIGNRRTEILITNVPG